MSKIVRSMESDGEKPKIGTEKNMLGVRVAPASRCDIPVDSDDNVYPATGGLSVTPAWKELPDFLIPKRLKHHAKEASGSNKLVVWTVGTGPFVQAPITDGLILRPDPAKPTQHGFVEPARTITIHHLQHLLANTQQDWTKDEIEQ